MTGRMRGAAISIRSSERARCRRPPSPWERDDYSWISNVGAPFAFTGSETRGGWTVGVGGEYAFTDWLTGFAEYDYYDFGTTTDTFTGALGTGTSNIKQTVSVAKGGINFKSRACH